MTPQQLRNSILQMAIEGKLVEQRPEEGTGAELYQLIQEEKLHFSKQQKFKSKEVINTNIEDECLSEIPSSWKWVRLGDVFDVVMGQSVSKESISRTNQGIEFHQGKINFGNKVLKKSSMATNKPLKIASEGAVLLCVRAPVGKVNITDRCICIGRGLSAILPYGFISSEFLYFWLMAHENIFIKKSTGTTFKAITKEIVKNLLIPLPPLREQKRILEKIETIFPIIDRYENAWQKLNELNKKFPEELQKSILQEAIQGKLCKQRAEEGSGQVLIEKILLEKERLIESGQIKKQKALPPIQEDERPFDIPDSWEWSYLGELFSHVAGKALNAKNTKGRKYKYLTTSNVYWGYFDLRKLKEMYYTEDEIEKYSVKYGDLLVLEGGDVGRSAIWNLEDSYCIQNHIHRLRPYDNICVKYFYYVIMYLKLTGNILGKGIGIKGLSSNALHCIKVPLPSLEEQFRIVKKVDKIITIINRYKKIFNCIGN